MGRQLQLNYKDAGHVGFRPITNQRLYLVTLLIYQIHPRVICNPKCARSIVPPVSFLKPRGFSLPFSSGPCFFLTLHHDWSIFGGPTFMAYELHWVRQGCNPCGQFGSLPVLVVFILSALWWTRIRGLWKLPVRRNWLWRKLGLALVCGGHAE